MEPLQIQDLPFDFSFAWVFFDLDFVKLYFLEVALTSVGQPFQPQSQGELEWGWGCYWLASHQQNAEIHNAMLKNQIALTISILKTYYN